MLIMAVPSSPSTPQQLNPPQQPVPETYFGMHIHGIDVPRPYNKRITPWPNLPFGAWRLMDAYVRWYDLEPRRNEFDFERLDKYVALAQQKHVKVLLPLFGTPPWASARPSEIERGNPLGSASEPANMDYWRSFVRAVATRYKGQIEAYEIWNEPNLKMFWTGSVEQLVTMTREAFEVIEGVDPTALVVSPSCTTESGPQYLDAFLKKGGGQFSDVIGYHFYVHTKPPEVMVDLATRVKETLRANHIDKPVWNTEAGAEEPKLIPSDESAAAWVSRALILVWASGVSRFYWYAWDNHGLLEMVEHDDVTQKPTAKAYARVHQWLAGATMKTCKPDSANKWICEIDRNGLRQWIVWNPDGQRAFDVAREWNITQETPLLGAKEQLRHASIQIGPTPVLLAP
jgi:hypothetical protein